MSNKSRRKRVAAIISEYRFNSHAELIIGRLMGQFGYSPSIDVVSIYVDQLPLNDLSHYVSKAYHIPIHPTIADALDVEDLDGIILICEHGNYPFNEKRQRMYPRRRFFEEIFQALDRQKITIPIFSDKHLAYDYQDTVWIYNEIKRRSIPFFGGSSLPLLATVPSIASTEMQDPNEILVVSWLHPESYGFHAMEIMQSVAELRCGGETGVEWVEALEGEDVWSALGRKEWPDDLLQAALSANPTTLGQHPRIYIPDPVLFIFQYKDGTRGYVIQLQEFVNQWSFAVRSRDQPIQSAMIDLDTWRPFGHFGILTQEIEELMLHHLSAVPHERTFLTSAMVNLGMEALYQKQRVSMSEVDLHFKHAYKRRVSE